MQSQYPTISAVVTIFVLKIKSFLGSNYMLLFLKSRNQFISLAAEANDFFKERESPNRLMSLCVSVRTHAYICLPSHAKTTLRGSFPPILLLLIHRYSMWSSEGGEIISSLSAVFVRKQLEVRMFGALQCYSKPAYLPVSLPLSHSPPQQLWGTPVGPRESGGDS